MNLFGLLLVGAGLFSIMGAVMNWDWFMNHHKAQFLVSIAGRTGARIFYGVLGAGIMLMGVLMTLGILQDAN